MPFNTSIYQQIQPNIAGQLAGSINEFADRRARLSDLAMQRDIQNQQMQQQAVTQGYQNRAAQRVEEAYPAQQADLELKRKKEAGIQANLGLVNEAMRAGKPEEAKLLLAQIYPEKAAEAAFTAPKEKDEGSPVKIVGADGKTYEIMSKSGRRIGEAPKPSALVNIGNLGTPIELTNREGKPVLVQMDKSGKIIPVPGGYGPKPAKEGGVVSTESERKAATLLMRLEGSQKQLGSALKESPESAKPGIAATALRGVGMASLANAMAVGPQRQQIEAAQLDMLDAALTLGTGASYTKEQLEGYRNSYFPQIGDKPPTIADKKARLDNVIQAAKIAAGRQAEGVAKELASRENNPAQNLQSEADKILGL